MPSLHSYSKHPLVYYEMILCNHFTVPHALVTWQVLLIIGKYVPITDNVLGNTATAHFAQKCLENNACQNSPITAHQGSSYHMTNWYLGLSDTSPAFHSRDNVEACVF